MENKEETLTEKQIYQANQASSGFKSLIDYEKLKEVGSIINYMVLMAIEEVNITGYAVITRAEIAKNLGINKITVYRALDALAEKALF